MQIKLTLFNMKGTKHTLEIEKPKGNTFKLRIEEWLEQKGKKKNPREKAKQNEWPHEDKAQIAWWSSKVSQELWFGTSSTFKVLLTCGRFVNHQSLVIISEHYFSLFFQNSIPSPVSVESQQWPLRHLTHPNSSIGSAVRRPADLRP